MSFRIPLKEPASNTHGATRPLPSASAPVDVSRAYLPQPHTIRYINARPLCGGGLAGSTLHGNTPVTSAFTENAEPSLLFPATVTLSPPRVAKAVSPYTISLYDELIQYHQEHHESVCKEESSMSGGGGGKHPKQQILRHRRVSPVQNDWCGHCHDDAVSSCASLDDTKVPAVPSNEQTVTGCLSTTNCGPILTSSVLKPSDSSLSTVTTARPLATNINPLPDVSQRIQHESPASYWAAAAASSKASASKMSFSSKPGISYIPEPAIRSDSAMYQAAYRPRTRTSTTPSSNYNRRRQQSVPQQQPPTIPIAVAVSSSQERPMTHAHAAQLLELQIASPISPVQRGKMNIGKNRFFRSQHKNNKDGKNKTTSGVVGAIEEETPFSDTVRRGLFSKLGGGRGIRRKLSPFRKKMDSSAVPTGHHRHKQQLGKQQGQNLEQPMGQQHEQLQQQPQMRYFQHPNQSYPLWPDTAVVNRHGADRPQDASVLSVRSLTRSSPPVGSIKPVDDDLQWGLAFSKQELMGVPDTESPRKRGHSFVRDAMAHAWTDGTEERSNYKKSAMRPSDDGGVASDHAGPSLVSSSMKGLPSSFARDAMAYAWYATGEEEEIGDLPDSRRNKGAGYLKGVSDMASTVKQPTDQEVDGNTGRIGTTTEACIPGRIQSSRERDLEDLMLALKLSAEQEPNAAGKLSTSASPCLEDLLEFEGSLARNKSMTDYVAAGFLSHSPTSDRKYPAPLQPTRSSEQLRILDKIREEQEKQELEMALKVSEQESKGAFCVASHHRPWPNQPSDEVNPSSTTTTRRDDVEDSSQPFRLPAALPSSMSSRDSSDSRRQELLERGASEIVQAIETGRAHCVICDGCGSRLQAPVSYPLVLCPRCDRISAVKRNPT